jgi:Lon protease-like protein
MLQLRMRTIHTSAVRAAGLLLFLMSAAVVPFASSFAPSSLPIRPKASGPMRPFQSSSSGDGTATSNNDEFMASLLTRVRQVNDRETKLPLVVLDSMLPRQVLKISVRNPLFVDLVRTRIKQETPWFGMLGLARVATGESVLMKSGVQVDIVGKPAVVDGGLQLELRGSRRFRIVGEVETSSAGWTEGRVEFQIDGDGTSSASLNGIGEILTPSDASTEIELAKARTKAQPLESLVKQWIQLARTKQRHPGQIDQLLIDLGPMPDSQDQPTNVAFWVGALINPIPAMGVALEIRPALLTATTAEERIDIALIGIQRSIRHIQGEPLL